MGGPFPALVIPNMEAGLAPPGSQFDTWWYNTASFLQNPIVFRAHQATTATSIPSSGVSTKWIPDVFDEDPYGGWNGVTNAWSPPLGYSGLFEITVCTYFSSSGNNSTNFAAAILTNNNAATPGYDLATHVGTQSRTGGVCGSCILYLEHNVTVAPAGRTFNATGAILTSLTAGQQSFISIAWLSQD